MSLTDNFIGAAKQIFLATENIKRLDDKVHSLAADVAALDRRVIRIEALIEMTKTPLPRRRGLQ